MYGKPSGMESDLNGWGPATLIPFGNVTGMPLALLHVPQGGAQNTPAQLGDLTHSQQRLWPSGVVKSATKTLPAFLSLLWSTPKEFESPRL